VANLELRLSNGDALQLRVDDTEAEIAALKEHTGRFADDWVDLTGPALGTIRREEIIAVVIR
jgi:hypothetical protein